MSMSINMVWIGNKLRPIHTACMRSFLRNGHEIVLHAYGKPDDTPSGVQLFDATTIMAESEIRVFKESNRLAYASDIYRYRIQRKGMGLYMDCDFFCLKPLTEAEYMFAWESISLIANGFLKIPHDSQLLNAIMKDSENPYFVPHWYKEKTKRKMRLKQILGRAKHVTKHR